MGTKKRREIVFDNAVPIRVRQENEMGNKVFVWEIIILNAKSKARNVLVSVYV